MKKSLPKSKKLTVTTEIVRTLSEASLGNVIGGGETSACSGGAMVSAIKARCSGQTLN
jgi:hypothetical protein